jgi:hypothetical protein
LAVFVLDEGEKPLMPCSEKPARARGRAVAHRRYPFTTRLKDRVGSDVQPVRVKSARRDNCRTKLAAHDFSRRYCLRTKPLRGSSTTHMLGAEGPNGNKVAIHVGLVAVLPAALSQRAMRSQPTPSIKLPHSADGYGYAGGTRFVAAGTGGSNAGGSDEGG